MKVLLLQEAMSHSQCVGSGGGSFLRYKRVRNMARFEGNAPPTAPSSRVGISEVKPRNFTLRESGYRRGFGSVRRHWAADFGD